MVKKINTLIEDIYKVVDEGVEDTEEFVNQFSEEISTSLKKRLQADKEEDRRSIRLSSIGQCIRKQWYNSKGYEQEKLQPHTKIKFIFGDLIEALVLCLAKLAGHEVRGEQDELSLERIKGHRDAVIDGYTVDVKSASARAFTKFQDGSLRENDSFGYIPQLAAYVEAAEDTSKEKAYNLAFHKELGKLALFETDPDDWPDIRERVKEVVSACEKDEPPARPYEEIADGKSGNMKLPVQCAYCHFKYECWIDANDGQGLRTFLYSNGPRHLTKVEKEPNVEEAL